MQPYRGGHAVAGPGGDWQCDCDLLTLFWRALSAAVLLHCSRRHGEESWVQLVASNIGRATDIAATRARHAVLMDTSSQAVCGLRAVGGGREVGAVQQWFAAGDAACTPCHMGRGALAWQSKAGVCAIGGPAALRAALEAAG